MNIAIIITIAMGVIVIGSLTLTWYFNLPSKKENMPGAPKPSKGTSNADRMGEEFFYNSDSTLVPSPRPEEDLEIVDPKKLELMNKLVEYNEPVPYASDLERLLTDDEVDIIEKYYGGFYVSVGVDMIGQIQVSDRANGLAKWYLTPQILAELMLEDL